MIGHLTGTIVVSELDWLILDVQGVGYEISVPQGMAGRLEKDPDELVSLWIHTSVREDAIDLYGFGRRDDRRLFRRLTSVNRIGPRLGLATLSELRPAEVVNAVRSEDVATFQRVSGIGKKTAQRLILELKNKLDDLIIEATVDSQSASHDRYDDLRSALLNLGVQTSAIDGVVSDLRTEVTGDEPVEDLVRRALQMLN